MAHSIKTEPTNEYGILVHQLPKKFELKVLDCFPGKFIVEVRHNAEGLRIYFDNIEHAKDSVRRRAIEVEGISYKMYPLVTNLTVHGIHHFATESTIKAHIKRLYNPVINIYEIEQKTRHMNRETVSRTGDYRVVLDVPEIFVNFELLPISLPEAINQLFGVSFFCRLCRCNGHMMYQCPESTKSSSVRISEQNYSIDSCRRISCETDFSDTLVNQSTVNQHRTDHFSNLRISETNSRFHVPPKYKEGQTHYPSGSHFVTSQFDQFEDPRKYIAGSGFNISKHRQISDNLNIPRDWHGDESVVGIQEEASYSKTHEVNNTASKNNNNEGFDAGCRSEDESLLQASDNESASEETETSAAQEYSFEQASSSSESVRQRKKNEFSIMFSSLFPSDTDPRTISRLRKTVESLIKTDSYDISEEVECELQKILDSNRGWSKDLTEKAERFLTRIERFLEKVRNKRREKREYQRKSIAQQSKSEPCRQRSLSSAVEEAVRMTTGILQPTIFISFLNQTYHRRSTSLISIASNFTEDFAALDKQLSETIQNYYRYGERSTDGDRDIKFIERLQRRFKGQTMKEAATEKCRIRRPSKEGTLMGSTPSRDSSFNDDESDSSSPYLEPMDSE